MIITLFRLKNTTFLNYNQRLLPFYRGWIIKEGVNTLNMIPRVLSNSMFYLFALFLTRSSI